MLAKSRPQLLREILPVVDLARSLGLYRQQFSSVELQRIEVTTRMSALVLTGTESERSGGNSEGSAMQLEVWHAPERQTPLRSTQHAPSMLRGHVGIALSDIRALVDRLAAVVLQVLQRPAALRPGGRRLAMIADPDGQDIELLEVP